MDTSWSDMPVNEEKHFLERRKNTIGSSDMPIILGVSPYKTPLELWKEKTGAVLPQAQNYAMAKGTRMEPIARDWFNKKTQRNYQPKLFKHQSIESFTANVDGFDSMSNSVVEIKYPGAKDHQIAAEGGVPEHYIPQLEWQYIVTNCDKLFYLSYNDNSQYIVRFPKPTKERVEFLINKAAHFLMLVQTNKSPELTDDDYLELDDYVSKRLGTTYMELDQLVRHYTEKRDKIRQEIEALAENTKHPKIKLGGVSIQKITKKGSIDYSKVPNLNDIDLEQYRKPSTQYYKVDIDKQ